MKKSFFKLFLAKNLIITLLSCVLAYVFNVYVDSKQYLFIYIVPFFAFLINFIAFAIAISPNSQRNINTMISALFGIKFFSYIILSIVFFVLESQKSVRLYFTLFLFVIYIGHTVFLLSNTLKYLKD